MARRRHQVRRQLPAPGRQRRREIIKDHNSIYSESFIQFFQSLFLVHITSRRPVEPTASVRDIDARQLGRLIPCEQSCQVPDRGSCSGRSVEELRRSR